MTVVAAPGDTWGIIGPQFLQVFAVLAVLGLVSLVFLPMWRDYVSAVLNARGGGGIFYSIGQAPMLLLPLAAWATSRRRQPRHV